MTDVASWRARLRTQTLGVSRATPAVLAYLFDRGIVPLVVALAEDPQQEQVIEGVWRLAQASVATGAFGVSSDRWRTSQGYPDRYFATLWTEVVPGLAQRLAGRDLLRATAQLFNLGERLGGHQRGLANDVIRRIAEGLGGAEPFERVLERVLADVGLWGPGLAGSGGLALWPLHRVDLWDADAPRALDGVAMGPTETTVWDAEAGVHVAWSTSDPLATRQVRRGQALGCARVLAAGEVRVMIDGTALRVSRGDQTRVAQTGLAMPHGVAMDPRGRVAVIDALSARVAFFMLEGAAAS